MTFINAKLLLISIIIIINIFSMQKYEPLLAHIQTSETSFQTLQMFDELVQPKIKNLLQITKYIIYDQKLYYDCHGICTEYSDDFTEYLNGIVENNAFKNTLFYLVTDEGIDFEDNLEWRDEP